MLYLLCRITVADFATWKRLFDARLQAQQAAGLKPERLWVAVENGNQVSILFSFTDIEKARSFVSTEEVLRGAAFEFMRPVTATPPVTAGAPK